jgi:hypothetical protein
VKRSWLPRAHPVLVTGATNLTPHPSSWRDVALQVSGKAAKVKGKGEGKAAEAAGVDARTEKRKRPALAEVTPLERLLGPGRAPREDTQGAREQRDKREAQQPSKRPKKMTLFETLLPQNLRTTHEQGIAEEDAEQRRLLKQLKGRVKVSATNDALWLPVSHSLIAVSRTLAHTQAQHSLSLSQSLPLKSATLLVSPRWRGVSP